MDGEHRVNENKNNPVLESFCVSLWLESVPTVEGLTLEVQWLYKQT